MIRTGLITLLISMLAGCFASEQEDLQAWMTSERNTTKPKVVPISEPTKFVPQSYTSEAVLEPFSSEKLAAVLKGAQSVNAVNSALIEPELNRRKEPLEDFPLDTMALVGSLTKQGQLVALIKVNDLLYQVKSGQYLGPNFGRILKITETEVVLREIVQDPGGEWVERQAALQLQEERK